MANLLLAGYFGSGNLGDDAVLLGFTSGLGNDSHNVTVMSGSPEETYRLYGYRSVDRRDMRAVKAAIEKCDILIFPGGSIFQDVTSVKSVAYYAKLVSMAKDQKKKVVMLGQGVGPLKTFLGKRMAAGAFNSADVLCVRDPFSIQTLKDIGVNKTARLTADTAFLLSAPTETSDVGNYKVGDMKTVGISVRPWGKQKETVQLFSDLTKLLFQANMMPVLIELDRNDDGPLIMEISKLQGGRVPDIRKLQTPMQVQQRMARMDAVIAMRLHAGILASTVGVPPFMVSYDPKVTAFAKMLDIGSGVSMEGLTAQRLFESFMGFQRDRERNERILERKREELTKLARGNIEIFREIVGSPATM